MALTITATITVNDDEAYTAREAAILSAFQAHPAGTAAPAAAAPAPAAEAPAPAAPRPTTKRAPKPAPAPEAEASTTPAVLDTTLDEPADEPEAAADEDLVGGTESKEYTLDDAVTAATGLINDGKVADVKAALAKAGGAKRVSQLKGAAITTFMEALGN